MSIVKVFESIDTTHQTAAFAYAAHSLAVTARLALGNEGTRIDPDQKMAAVEEAVHIIEAMMGVVIEGAEEMERALKRGSWQEGDVA